MWGRNMCRDRGGKGYTHTCTNTHTKCLNKNFKFSFILNLPHYQNRCLKSPIFEFSWSLLQQFHYPDLQYEILVGNSGESHLSALVLAFVIKLWQGGINISNFLIHTSDPKDKPSVWLSLWRNNEFIKLLHETDDVIHTGLQSLFPQSISSKKPHSAGLKNTHCCIDKAHVLVFLSLCIF